MTNHIKELIELVEREIKLQTKSITKIKKEYHQDNIDTLSYAIKCCEMVEKLSEKRLMKIFNILKRNTIQTQHFKAPIIHYMQFEKVAKEISKEIR